MKIERLELRLLKLPLVHFFETSFGRIDDKHFIIVRVDGDGVDGLRRMRRRAGSVLQRRDQRDRVAHHRGASSRRACSASSSRHPREVVPALQGDPRPQHGEGRRRDGGVGSACARQHGQPPLATSSAARAIASRRACRSASRTSLDELVQEGRARARRRLSADQDQRSSRAGTSTRSQRAARAIRRDSR